MNNDIIKESVRSLLPEKIYNKLILFRRKFICPIIYRKYRNKLKKFTKPQFKILKVNNKDFNLFIDPKNGEIDNGIFVNGFNEQKITKLMLEKIQKNDVFLDIGSNIGYFTNLLPLFCKEVIAFEPLRRIYKQNLKSIKKNSYNNVNLYNYACGNHKSEEKIYVSNANVGGSSLIKQKLKKEKVNIDRIEKIKIIRLDDFLKKDQRVNFIKIDVEGFEFEVLKGMKKVLMKNKPKIIMEFSPFIYESMRKNLSLEILNFLKEIGYTVYDINTNKIFNFKKMSKTMGHTDLYCR